jgi:hypothetical protein
VYHGVHNHVEIDKSTRRANSSAYQRLEKVPQMFAGLVLSFARTLEQSGLTLDERSQTAIGEQTARHLVAQQRWAALVGDTFDTAEVRQLLNLTRQALEARRRNGSLIGLASDRSGTLYPAWQFDTRHQRVRPEIASLVSRFRDEADDVTEAEIVAWASTSQADLNGETPAAWLVAEGDIDQLLTAASRAASHLAQ